MKFENRGDKQVSVSIMSLYKTFIKGKSQIKVLHDINVRVNQGEFVTIIGPSGCGKSTLLKLLAGLDNDFTGSIKINNQESTGPSIKKGFIFQEHRLFPWLTVEKNICCRFIPS